MTVCDFCNTPGPTQAYDAGSEIRVSIFLGDRIQVGPGMMYSRFWAACDVCGDYIDRGDIDGLKEAVIALHTAELQGVLGAKDFGAWRKCHNLGMTALYDELKKRKLVRVGG